MKKDATWTLSYVAKFCDGPILNDLMTKSDLGIALINGMNYTISAGELEVGTAALNSIRKLLQINPQMMSIQVEEHQGLSTLSRVFHTAHHQSETYRVAEHIKENYFRDH
jgi:hypothetical protein